MPVIAPPGSTNTTAGLISAQKAYSLKPHIKAVVYSPYMERTIRIDRGQILYPTKCSIAPGPYGGSAEIIYTAHAFSNKQDDYAEKLIGSYVRIFCDGEAMWAGVITGVQYQHTDETNMVTYQCRDLWHVLADKSLRGVFMGTGYTIIEMLRYLRGEAIGWYVTDPSQAGVAHEPLLPTDKTGSIVVDINTDDWVTMTQWWSHAYSNIDIARLITEIAEEKYIDHVVIVPSGTAPSESGGMTFSGSTEVIGWVKPIIIDKDRYKSVVVGSYSDDDYTSQKYIPRAISITGTSDYSGIVTEIREVGGEVTESCAIQLIPAWTNSFAVGSIVDLIDRSGITAIYSSPHEYGLYGRLWALDQTGMNAIIPFTDVNTMGQIGAAASNDSCRIFEFTGAGSKRDEYDDDTLWQEVQSNYIFTHYNPASVAGNPARFGWSGKYTFLSNNLALVLFDQPQVRYGKIINPDTGFLEDDTAAGTEKILVFQGMRSMGQLYYSTGHKPTYPRPRYRYMSNPEMRQHLSSFSTTSGHWAKRYTIATQGRQEMSASFNISMYGALQEEALRFQKQMGRPANSIDIEFSGIDRTWQIGDRIKQILDTNGAVIKDNLEWYVMEVQYDFEDNHTMVSLGDLKNG